MMSRCSPGLNGSAKCAVRASAAGLLAIAALSPLSTACSAADSNVSAANRSAQDLIDRATAGSTVVIPADADGTLAIYDRSFAEPLTVDMSRSNVAAVIVRRSNNVRLINGRVTGTNERGSYGIKIEDSQHVEVSNVTVSQAQAGIWVRTSQDILVSKNNLTDLISDGITLTSSQRVKVLENYCSNFHPVPKIFDEQGNQIEDGDHPDCIQGWSLPDHAPNSDLEIIGNRGIGSFQGVFLNNPMVGGRGYDRVTVTDNKMQIGWYHGIYLENVRGGLVTRNAISGTGARDIRGKVFNRPVRPFITIDQSTDINSCGNTVADFPTGEGTRRCKRLPSEGKHDKPNHD